MNVQYISQQDANNIKKQMPKSKTMLEYEVFWQRLPKGQIVKIDIAPKDGIKPNTVRSRLIRASKCLKLTAKTKRVGNVVLFWKEE